MKIKRVALAIMVALAAVLFSACSGAPEISDAEKRAGERAADLTAVSATVASGALEGRSGHKMSGTVRLRESEGKFTLEFGDDFVFDGAPAPVVAFGRDGYKADTQIGTLRQNQGGHAYEVPGKTAAAEPDEVWVWCTDYDVPLGTAKLIKN